MTRTEIIAKRLSNLPPPDNKIIDDMKYLLAEVARLKEKISVVEYAKADTEYLYQGALEMLKRERGGEG